MTNKGAPVTWKRRGIFVAVTVTVLLVLLVAQSHFRPAGIRVGKPLPPGRVTPQIVLTGDAAVLLAPDGSLWTWGGSYNRLTNIFPQPATCEEPIRVGKETNWSKLMSGYGSLLLQKEDGSLWEWGRTGYASNYSYFNGCYTYTSVPTQVGTDTNWTRAAVCHCHALALKTDGSL